ncbi:hypothetical protein DSB74_26890, partial [Salmonella enterica subsp. enterica serovar Typhimurium]
MFETLGDFFRNYEVFYVFLLIDSMLINHPHYRIVSVKYSDLVEQLEIAKQVPRKVNAFKTKRLNIWVSGKSAFFN